MHEYELRLRQATIEDRDKIYRWMARSDATPEMMGPPRFPDLPIPSYNEFCDDYDETAFLDDGNYRLFIIVLEGEEIGALSYTIRKGTAELDLWIANRENWGRGYGSTALKSARLLLEERGEVNSLVIRPSVRNKRAIAAYRKAGFVNYDSKAHNIPEWCYTEGFDYDDAVVLVIILP